MCGSVRRIGMCLLLIVVLVVGGLPFSSTAQAAGCTVSGWGLNTANQAAVLPTPRNVIAIAASGNHTVVLQEDGKVVAWGDNNVGQTDVPAALGKVTAIAAGGYHSVALRCSDVVSTNKIFLPLLTQ